MPSVRSSRTRPASSGTPGCAELSKDNSVLRDYASMKEAPKAIDCADRTPPSLTIRARSSLRFLAVCAITTAQLMQLRAVELELTSPSLRMAPMARQDASCTVSLAADSSAVNRSIIAAESSSSNIQAPEPPVCGCANQPRFQCSDSIAIACPPRADDGVGLYRDSAACRVFSSSSSKLRLSLFSAPSVAISLHRMVNKPRTQ